MIEYNNNYLLYKNIKQILLIIIKISICDAGTAISSEALQKHTHSDSGCSAPSLYNLVKHFSVSGMSE